MKKGVLGTTMALVFTAFLLTALILSSFILVDITADDVGDKIDDSVQEVTYSMSLINYLRTPVGEQMISDVIVDSYLSDDYALLESESEKIFEVMLEEETYWELIIKGEDEESFEHPELEGDEMFSDTVYLPVYFTPEDEQIEVTLRLYE